jgi:Trk-type K+ transport system membrane component
VTTTTPAGVPATATPTTAPGTAAAALTTTSSKLPSSDTLPKVGKGQLFAFNHFTSKDPFVQQVNPNAGQAASSGSSTSGSSTSASASNTPTAAAPTAKVTQQHSTRVLAVTGAARISVNGRIQVVRVGASFPSANPLFTLVSVKNGVARIGIASGSYSSGARTVSLGAGRTLTLVDTADGIRYQLQLLSK